MVILFIQKFLQLQFFTLAYFALMLGSLKPVPSVSSSVMRTQSIKLQGTPGRIQKYLLDGGTPQVTDFP